MERCIRLQASISLAALWRDFAKSWVATQAGAPQWWTLRQRRRRGRRRLLPPRRHLRRKPAERQTKTRTKKPKVPADVPPFTTQLELDSEVRNTVVCRPQTARSCSENVKYSQSTLKKNKKNKKKCFPIFTYQLNLLSLLSILSLEQGYGASTQKRAFCDLSRRGRADTITSVT